MTDKHDVSLTDFIYAVVVGAAFQNIKPPLFSDANALILFCFFLVVDDWVLYHAQVQKLPLVTRAFAIRLLMDLVILVLWYAAAVQCTLGMAGVATFFGVLSCYYFATGAWEAIFLTVTRNSWRFWCDLSCGIYLGILAGLVGQGFLGKAASWQLLLLSPILLMRLPAWRSLVFTPRPLV